MLDKRQMEASRVEMHLLSLCDQENELQLSPPKGKENAAPVFTATRYEGSLSQARMAMASSSQDTRPGTHNNPRQSAEADSTWESSDTAFPVPQMDLSAVAMATEDGTVQVRQVYCDI